MGTIKFDEKKLDSILYANEESGPSFSQSKFQIEKFVIGAHSSDARKYRQVLLELRSRYTNLKKSRIKRRKLEAELNLHRNRLEVIKDENRKTIKECQIEEIELDLRNEEKLIIDAINECNLLYSIFESLPKISDEEFEKQELSYWKDRLTTDAHLQIISSGSINEGTQKSLLNLGINPIKTLLELKQLNGEIVKKLSIEDKTNEKC